MAILIRRARMSELDETARLLGRVFEACRPPDALPREHHERFARHLAEVADVRSRLADTELFVAVESDRILGTATLYPPASSAPYVHDEPWPRDWASLRLLAVAPTARGRGIGRMLGEARIERARELGAPVVALHTAQLFEVAREMYRRRGWQRAPEYDHYPLPGLCAEAYILRLS